MSGTPPASAPAGSPANRGGPKADSGKNKKRKRHPQTYSTYIYKVLRQVHPDTGISKRAMMILHSMVADTLYRLVIEANRLCVVAKRTTLSSREIQSAVMMIYPGEVAKHGVSEGTKAMIKFNGSSMSKSKSKKGESEKKKSAVTTKSAAAGLQFPVARIFHNIKSLHPNRVTASAPVYLAAVLEYLVAEVLELAGNSAKDHKKKRITPRDITLAVRNDVEINKLLESVTLPTGGVIPHVHKALLGKKSQDASDAFEGAGGDDYFGCGGEW
jgi:histone H2A